MRIFVLSNTFGAASLLEKKLNKTRVSLGSLERLGLLLVTPSKWGIPSSLVRCFGILTYIYCCLNIPGNLTRFFFALNLATDQNNVLGRALFSAQFTGEINRVAMSLCFIPGNLRKLKNLHHQHVCDS